MTRRVLVACVLAVALAACGARGPSFQGSDVTGSSFGRDFSLADPAGRTRTLADYRGKAVALFFGYTQCPDVCPTTMTMLREVKDKLGADGAKLQVVFVTVDPERDTQEVLSAYVPGFDPSFVGLRGDLEATTQAAKEFKIFFTKAAGSTPTSYTVDHSAGIFIFDPQGRLRLFANPSLKVDDYVHDIRLLVAGK